MADMFPLLHPPKGSKFRSLPWAMLAPHEEQARRNHDQSLARLAERGGLGPIEAVAVLSDVPYRVVRELTEELAMGQLEVLLEKFQEIGGNATG